MQKKILIVSHLPGRDDVADLCLGRALANRGAMVWTYPIMQNPREAICIIKPDIVILPEIRLEFTRDIAKYCKQWGAKVVQKRCEMGVTADTEMTEELERCLFGNLNYQEYIDLDLVWGAKFADMVIAHGTPREKVRVVGALGFDPYFLEAPVVDPHEKKRVLFAGGFGYADKNAIYAIPEAKPGDKLHYELVKADRENRAAFTALIGAFIERYPDWEVWVRPHPGEYFSYYKGVFGDKIKSACEMHALVALHMVDLIIHPGSTMAFEANLIGKPTLNFRNTNLDALVGRISPLYYTEEEVLAAVDVLELGRSNADPKVIEKLSEYYGIVDGKAGERAADYIMKLPVSANSIPNTWPDDKPQYITKGVYVGMLGWQCVMCGNSFISDPGRDCCKCPFCGIVVAQRPVE